VREWKGFYAEYSFGWFKDQRGSKKKEEYRYRSNDPQGNGYEVHHIVGYQSLLLQCGAKIAV
jgi:hypothetical protein